MTSDSGVETVEVVELPAGARRLVFTGPDLYTGQVVINLDRVAAEKVSKALAIQPNEQDRQ